MIGGAWSARASRHTSQNPVRAELVEAQHALQTLTSQVVFAHGALAENAPPHFTTASDFAKRITRSV
jgi:hypothetical protein